MSVASAMTLYKAEEARAPRKVLVVVFVGGPIRVHLRAGLDAVASAQDCCHPESNQRILLALGYQIPRQMLRQAFLLSLKDRGR